MKMNAKKSRRRRRQIEQLERRLLLATFFEGPNLIIQGTALGEGYDAAPGFIRAFDTRTGKTVWTFHTIPQPGEPGYETWPPDAYKETGGVNSWAGMSVDHEKGIVFAPKHIPLAGRRTP